MRKLIFIFLFLIIVFGISGFLFYKDATMPKIPEKFETLEFETEKKEILVGVISDTHISDPNELPQKIKEIFKSVDLIIHAGDIIDLVVIEKLQELAPVFAVYGNMDFGKIREKLPEVISLKIFDWKIGIVHTPVSSWLVSHLDLFGIFAKNLAEKQNFNILIFGHTHKPLLKKENGILLINPGSPTLPFFSKPSVAILKITANSYQGEIISLSKN